MKSKQIFTIVSGSALASGMAHGAVLYSGQVNTTLASVSGATVDFDLNQDGTNDFYLGFAGNNNLQKPYIEGYPGNTPGSAPLAQLASDGAYGLPVTAFGTLIDSNYLSLSTGQAYFKQEDTDGSATTVGEWGVDNITEGYVGLEMWDGSGNTNYGWVQIIYNLTAQNLTLVDYAYETTAFKGIPAGATNEVGAPDIYVQPLSQTNGVGANVQFSVTALATPPPTYVWEVGPTNGLGPYTALSDGGTISGSTNATLTIDGATATNVGDYRVVISNSLGSATSIPPATLTLVSPVVTPPAPTLFGGLTANFNVSISGGLTPTFQWRQNGTNLSDGGRISGSVTSHLQINNLQGTDAGSYDVLVNFGSSPAPSAAAVLTVLPITQESLYDAAVLAAGPVVYYRLNETGNPASSNLVAYDNVSGLNGTYGSDVTNGFSGTQGPDAADGFPGFPTSNNAALFTPSDINSQITTPAWNLNTDTATFTFWVNQAAIQAYSTAILWSGTNSSDYAGIDYYYDAGTGAGQPGNVDLGYTWNEGNSPAFEFWDSGIMPPVDQWSMVALVIEPPNTILYVLDADATNINLFPGTNNIFPFTNSVMSFSTPETIGNNPNVLGGTEGFNGTLADMAVFNQALSSNQVQTLYNAALGILPPLNLQITTVGTDVQITWPMGSLLESTNVNGPWTTNYLASSPFTVAPTGSGGSMFYRAVVP